MGWVRANANLERRPAAAFGAELIGTFLLVFFICAIVSVNSPAGIGSTDFAVIGLAHFFVLAVLVFVLGGVSGGHFNPAVTTALTAIRQIHVIDAIGYIVCQCAGAILGALVVKLLLLHEGQAVHYGATILSHQHLRGANPGLGLLAEAIGTFMLMWAIMGVAVNPRGPRETAPLAIGGALALGVMVMAPLTGAGFNPARSLGPAIVAGTFPQFWVYVVGPVAGALLAAFAYVLIGLRGRDMPAERPVETLR